MSIMDWPADERPREKLLRLGPDALSDAELLAIFLRTGRRGLSAVDLARQLLADFGGLRPLLASDRQAFTAHAGLGAAKYAQLQAVLAMAQRHLWAELSQGQSLSSPSQTRAYLAAQLSGYEREVFAAVFLDNRHRVLAFEELFRGTIDGTSVHPRELVKRTLTVNAAAVIVAHNHPSGVAEPSRADEAITQRLRDALALVDVRLLDHFIVGDGLPVSLAERGLI